MSDEIKRLQRRNAELRRQNARLREAINKQDETLQKWNGWQPGVWTQVLTLSEPSPALRAVVKTARVCNLLVTLHEDGGNIVVRVGRKP